VRDDLLTYYNRELAFLRRMGSEFAARYPKVAGRLQLEPNKCEDPHVERLLEGFALLAARVHLRIDDDFPEIAEALLNIVYPHAVRPTPSMSLVEFHPDPEQGKLTSGLRIPAGTTLFSRPVGGVPTRFATSFDTTLWPLRTAAVRWAAPHQLNPTLRAGEAVGALSVQLEALPDVSIRSLPLESLRFHLAGEPGIVWTLHELLGSRCTEVVIREVESGGRVQRSVTLPASSVSLAGFGRDEGVIPWEGRSFPGYRLLQEYFVFPEKFAFFDLSGLEILREAGFDQRAEIVFLFRSFERPERRAELETGVRADTVRLGCTPVVNLYKRVAEPVLITGTRQEYPLVADIRRRDVTGIFSVDSVVTVAPATGEVTPVEPFYGYRQGSTAGGRKAFWYTRRRPAPGQEGSTEVLISFVDLSGRPTRPGTDTATARITCHDGQLPSRLPLGDPQGDFEMEGGGPIRKIVALVKPTPLIEPLAGEPRLWRLVSQLSLNYTSLVEGGIGSLREVLQLHNVSGSAAGERQLLGLASLTSAPAHALVQSPHGLGFARGHRVELEVDEEEFTGGSAFLMGAVIERFLALYTSMNTFSKVALRSRQRRELIREWEPRHGWKPLL